ncbi:MAG: CRISPR-associated endonuclease Cas2, partial [Armatimonadetes bacterium]|nr:CRISPR-associated endonuclease Cas2 [Armatimonadota bacterium]
MLYIAPYDITPDADRGKVHTLLSSFGNRVQYSVF